jgi:hypothetical protein
MIYYKHKLTGEVIGSLNNLRDLVIGTGVTSFNTITDVIMPNRVLGNGIICHCMTHVHIRDNYNRISRAKALEICPDFGQWRHIDDQHNYSVTYLGHRYLQDLEPMRKKPFGTPFTEYGKKRTLEYQMELN